MIEANDDVATTPATTTTMTVFPVVLYDGEREIDVGNIEIHPDLVFKQFQMMLSNMIGISYNNLTTYLIDSKKSKISPDRRKFLITGKVNFAVIVRESNCFFLVVLKRSRRDRRRKLAKHMDSDSLNWNNNYYDLSYDSNDAYMSVPNPYFYDDRFHDLLMNRGNYMNNLNVMLNPPLNLNLNFPMIGDVYPRVSNGYGNRLDRSLCEECRVAEKEGNKAEFHLCVYDEVVVGGFRSPAGPVSRPV